MRGLDAGKVIAFGEVLPYQPAGILTGSSFPGGVGVSEVEVRLQGP